MILDGRLVWMLDAYTTTHRFPYSAQLPLGNYIRNSVKVVIDAYDGTPVFYRMDHEDPILAAWAATFPNLFIDGAEMSEELRAHLRYPVDLFTAQSDMYAIYHMTDAQIFYNREDEWEVPSVGRKMEPYYTIMKLPGEEREEFILMLPFVPRAKPNLSAWLVARSDGDAYGQMRVYKFPKEKMVYGPNMVVARINQDDRISEKLSLWNQQGSEAVQGTLLVIPIEESLIYIQPLYLRAESGSIPELKRVIVGYENQIAMEPTLELGLARIFGGDGSVLGTPAGADGDSPTSTASWQQLAIEAQRRYETARAAVEAGDWTAYGHELSRLEEVLVRLQSEAAASGAADAQTPDPEATPDLDAAPEPDASDGSEVEPAPEPSEP